MKIAVIDYGMGNVGSIVNMIKKIGHIPQTARHRDELCSADKYILPGVGSFDQGVERLRVHGLWDGLEKEVFESRKPILGICLGMHLMAESSEEGKMAGWGWFKARVKRFAFHGEAIKKIPHMGWNTAHINQPDSPLFKSISSPQKYYFLHSYYFQTGHEEDVTATTDYGFSFASAVERGHIFGVQFHPEKSHRYGMNLLRNFVEMNNANIGGTGLESEKFQKLSS